MGELCGWRLIAENVHLRRTVEPGGRDPALSHCCVVRLISHRMDLRPACMATTAVVPAPPNGSSTTPPNGAPARMHGRIKSGRKVAKWASLKACVATVHTLRLLCVAISQELSSRSGRCVPTAWPGIACSRFEPSRLKLSRLALSAPERRDPGDRSPALTMQAQWIG